MFCKLCYLHRLVLMVMVLVFSSEAQLICNVSSVQQSDSVTHTHTYVNISISISTSILFKIFPL